MEQRNIPEQLAGAPTILCRRLPATWNSISNATGNTWRTELPIESLLAQHHATPPVRDRTDIRKEPRHVRNREEPQLPGHLRHHSGGSGEEILTEFGLSQREYFTKLQSLLDSNVGRAASLAPALHAELSLLCQNRSVTSQFTLDNPSHGQAVATAERSIANAVSKTDASSSG